MLLLMLRGSTQYATNASVWMVLSSFPQAERNTDCYGDPFEQYNKQNFSSYLEQDPEVYDKDTENFKKLLQAKFIQ